MPLLRMCNANTSMEVLQQEGVQGTARDRIKNKETREIGK